MKHTHKSTHGIQFWESQKEHVLEMYDMQGLSASRIAKEYGCDPSTVSKHLRRWHYPTRRSRYNAKYQVDSVFFKNIETEAQAYVLGLLLADGHVSKQNSVMIAMKDLDVVEKYKAALKSTAPIRVDRYGNYQLNIKCKELADDLRRIGFHNRKSYDIDLDLILSHVPKSLEHHFVRGLFDGDGSIKIYHYAYLHHPQYHFGFTGLKQVVEYVKEFFGITTKTVHESELTYSCVSSGKETICKIFNTMYNNASIYMDRKYNTFLQIV